MIDLKPFCAEPGGQYEWLERPLSRSGHTWASNGHIMVRVPRRPDVPLDLENGSSMLRVFDSVGWDGPFIALPTAEVVDGKVILGDLAVQEKYYRLMQELPNITVRKRTIEGRLAGVPLPFKFYDGAGVVMPILAESLYKNRNFIATPGRA